MLHTAVTQGIQVSVRPHYREPLSTPQQQVFSYHIHIRNQSPHAVQLLTRHWIIKDSNANRREVQGDGVVGEQPILEAGASYEYESWCPLATDIGTMQGTYGFRRLADGALFKVAIPRFHLIATSRLN